MATGGTDIENREYLFRLQIFIIDGGLLLLRNILDQRLTAKGITLGACLKNERATITSLRSRGIITQVQYDVLFPSGGRVPTTSDLDIILIISLLRNLKSVGLNKKFNWNATPVSTDLSLEADICRLQHHKKSICHTSKTTRIQETDFTSWWNEIEQIFVRQSPSSLNIQHMIADFQMCPLGFKEKKRIRKEIEKWEKYEAKVERLQEIKRSLKEDITGVKADVMNIMKDEIREIKTDVSGMKDLADVEFMKGDLREIKTDVTGMKDLADDVQENVSHKTGEPSQKPSLIRDILEVISWSYKRMTYYRLKTELKERLIKFYKEKRSTFHLSPLVEEIELNLAGFYVMPDIVSIKQTSLTSCHEERSLVRSLKDLLVDGSENQQKIYLSADAGFGKTAFSKYLAITWCQAFCPDSDRRCFKDEELEALANFEFLFLVLLRDSTSVCSIDEMIEQQIISKLAPSASRYQLQEILRREKLLIILDGLDEWIHPDNGCSNQSEKIPHRYARDNCVILTTTRPWKLGVSNLKTSDINKKVELVKLNEDSMRLLEENAIRKMSGVKDYSELRRKTREFDEVIKERGLEHMQTIPLLLMYITCLWCNKIPIGDSKVEVYINITEFLLSITAQKHPEVLPSSEPSHSDIPEYFKKHKFCKKFHSLLTALAELAYHTLFNEKRETTLVFDESVAAIFLKADDMKLGLLSGILTGSTTRTLIERKSRVSFSHKIVQEFFAAIFISSQSDGQKAVVEKCKNIQSILDMSMIYEFLSKMNSKMMCEMSAGLMSVINEDEETRKYRTSADYMYIISEPLYNIQEMLLSCFQQMTGSEFFKLCLQDVFIDHHKIYDKRLQRLSKQNNTQIKSLCIDTRYTSPSSSLRDIIKSFCLTDLNNLHKLYYQSDLRNDQDFILLLFPSLRTISLSRLSLVTFTNDRKLCDRLETLKNIQYLYITDLVLSHEMLKTFYNFICGNKTIKQLILIKLFCIEHCRDCKMMLNLSKNFKLNNVHLSHINLDECSLLLSRDMLNIVLEYIEISGECLSNMVENMETLSHLSVTVKMSALKPETEYKRIRNYIRSSQTFVVTVDDDDWPGQFVFQTRKPSKE